jgi:5-methylcytosine-specific restriction protein B
MSRIFLGKISKNYPQQFEENFYAAGKKESSWYGGLEVGDYVFPSFNSSVKKLWRVKEFSDQPNPINPEGSVKFELIKEYKEPIAIASTFARYKHFHLNLITVNKFTKSTASEKIGFYEIHCDDNCPPPEQIDFSESRNIYIALETPFKAIVFKEGDIRVLLGSKKNMKIDDIQIFTGGKFVTYDELLNLYKKRNKPDELYTLQELLEFAKNDGAIKKEKFLNAAIDEISKNGVFSVSSPIGLYDNLLVGRKRTQTGKKEEDVEEINIDNGDPDVDEFELTAEEFDEYKEYVDLLKFSPNLILYGPPGTGKTYSAQKILEAFELDRTKKVKPFKEIQNEGRVTFVTFHQSFSYEEFVEGLRPIISGSDEKDNSQDGENLKYKVQPGILLTIANNAARSQITTDLKENDFDKVKDTNRIWKISLGVRGKEEWVYVSCIRTNTIAIGWFDDKNIAEWDYDTIYKHLSEDRMHDDPSPKNNANSINNFVNELQEGDLVLVFASQTSIRAIGMVDGPYEWKSDMIGKYAHRRKVKWLKVYDKPIDIRKYNGGKNLSQVTLYELSNVRFLDIKELFEESKVAKKSEQNKAVPYFLIIDEINRGNISKIFGELITLVEKDKRDKIKVRLPYSQKEFSLPSNLFILGTMNTADRSIAVLDTALRRRFIFKEIEPNVDVIKAENQLIEGLDLALLFEALNSRITNKLDRDHRLGHSYFLEVFRLADFRIVWYYQIIPLLMEYFYNDPESIAGIITDSFIDKKSGQVKWIVSDDEFKTALLTIK